MTTRREALVALGALALVPSCGTSTPAMPTDGGPPGCPGMISSNHGHRLTVPQADVDAGTARDYDIRGSAGHTHTVSLSAADFTLLQTSGSVIVTSSAGGGHEHMVTVNC
jgi:hypothetical protein